LSRAKNPQHGYIPCIGVPAGVGIDDIDDSVPLGGNLPRARAVPSGIKTGLSAKPLNGVPDGPETSLRGRTGAGL
jgi:hypothetical protein